MSSQVDENQGVAVGIVAAVVVLVVAMAIGVGIYKKGHKAKAAAAPVATAPHDAAPAPAGTASEPAPAASAPVADGASVVVEAGVVKFYFASGKSDIAAGAKEALADVVHGVAGGKKAVVSGFHDTTGNAAANAEISKLRAFAVRDALIAAGVAQDKIELKKPEDMAVSGPASEARRVEVTLQ
jgi:outer membrane protein OmpA-like peptidoglycan-associated protein